jgi:hypothetical protein
MAMMEDVLGRELKLVCCEKGLLGSKLSNLALDFGCAGGLAHSATRKWCSRIVSC